MFTNTKVITSTSQQQNAVLFHALAQFLQTQNLLLMLIFKSTTNTNTAIDTYWIVVPPSNTTSPSSGNELITEMTLLKLVDKDDMLSHNSTSNSTLNHIHITQTTCPTNSSYNLSSEFTTTDTKPRTSNNANENTVLTAIDNDETLGDEIADMTEYLHCALLQQKSVGEPMSYNPMLCTSGKIKAMLDNQVISLTNLLSLSVNIENTTVIYNCVSMSLSVIKLLPISTNWSNLANRSWRSKDWRCSSDSVETTLRIQATLKRATIIVALRTTFMPTPTSRLARVATDQIQ